MYRTRVLGYQGIALYRATNNPSGPVTVTGPRALYRADPSDPVWRSGDQSDRHPSGQDTSFRRAMGQLLIVWDRSSYKAGITPRLPDERLSETVGLVHYKEWCP